jgi:tRNA A-37 threonylcarbamoyl transferase component Bud32
MAAELVNQGAFGCLYHPGIECSGKTMDNRRYATKLVVQDEVADNEVAVGEIVKGIVNYGVNFVPVIDTCTVKLEKVRRHNPTALNKCDVATAITDPKVKFVLMKMPYIDSLYFYDYLDSMGDNKKKIISCIFDTYSYLIESIERLVEHEVVHYDINMRNILMNLKTDTPVIIDFGLSIPDVKRFEEGAHADKGNDALWATYFYKYAPEYYAWPLEAHVINFLQNVSETLTRADVETICETCVNANAALRMFSKGFRARYLKACIEQCEQWIGVERNAARAALMKGWPTWDNYSLSVAYLQILEFIYSENGFTDNHLVIQYVELLLENVHPDPARRKTVNDTKRTFTDLFYMNKKVETYDSIVETFNTRAFAFAQSTVKNVPLIP